jgi:uncharacterized membrane protein YidH (DUF202 family)
VAVSSDRVDEFKQEIADMKVRDPATARDRLWLRASIVIMVAGFVVTIIGYLMSHNTDKVLDQNDALIVAIAGLTAAVIGAAVFVRYSLASFLRFWLARFIYEQQSQTDRIVEKLK